MGQGSARGPVLVADIGSTNARLAVAQGSGRLSRTVHYPIAEFHSARELLGRYLEGLGPMRFEGVCLALAGPLEGRRITLCNAGLTFDSDAVAAWTGCDEVHLINDFVAVGHAIPQLEAQQLRRLGGTMPARGVKAALGPGTGLGMGILVPVGDGWRVVASEGGHGAFAPRDALETELLTIMMRRHDPVFRETLVSGPGLLRLYRGVCELWGCPPELDGEREVTRRALDASDPVCQQTLEVFCSMLGSVAADLALTAGAEGGVYIAGGIVPQMVDFLAASSFRERFERQGPLTEYCRRIPVFVVDEPQLGLRGALASFLEAQEARRASD